METLVKIFKNHLQVGL